MRSFTRTIEIDGRSLRTVDLEAASHGRLAEMPLIHRILLENIVRQGDAADIARRALVDALDCRGGEAELPFLPGRVMMHDTTCGPALVDIAALRDVVAESGGDPSRLNPGLRVDVSTDHSLAVDVFATTDAAQRNLAREYERNSERYALMKWAAASLTNMHVHPPGTGIMHTLNLERLATVVTTIERDGETWAIPDTLIGTDSHTPMINGIGVLGWGVGGLEAESVMFGEPIMLRVPDVVGVRLGGEVPAGVLATDLALTVTERLRRIDLQDRYVEFFGPGIASLTAGDRAVVANMTPEFGANTAYFPIDAATIAYLNATGRNESHCKLVELYAKAQCLWHNPASAPRYSETIDIDLSAIRPSLAGPKRPQDRIDAAMTRAALGAPPSSRYARMSAYPVAIAAITSCTNTSDPRLLIAAGLLARKARLRGLKPPSWVKTSLAPGSPSAEAYLRRAGLLEDLEALGFGIVGYGCTTCIGNSGALTETIAAALAAKTITPVAVLSGNRNFPGRVHPDIENAFLASPPMVIAFALAGDAAVDITTASLGQNADGRDVRLADLWPTSAEIDAATQAALSSLDIQRAYADAAQSEPWRTLEAPITARFPWGPKSTYLRRPPFVATRNEAANFSFQAHPLLVLGDDITTDHISPAGQISATSAAGRHLIERGENPRDLNVFASRRGNWEVMVRGLFTNKSVRNLLDPILLPGETIHAQSGERMPLWQAAERYLAENRVTVIIAGERYGMGSSRDWAAKGVALLGVRAVIAKSFERIHRSNLIGMGVLPLRLLGELQAHELAATDVLDIHIEPGDMVPRGNTTVSLRRAGSGEAQELPCRLAIETAAEVATLFAGGTLSQIVATP